MSMNMTNHDIVSMYLIQTRGYVDDLLYWLDEDP